MPAATDQDYFVTREREALAMAREASEPSVQNIHLELAKRYADLAHDAEISALVRYVPAET